ncbi:hypothetical protein LDENG_00267580 [Lucifuga dentata]|nr:hypothetical protein LDENG_00267580 [Lucifuga dentata]
MQALSLCLTLRVAARDQKRQREEQLSHQDDSEKLHRDTLYRLKGELEEKHERWLSCQRRCDSVQEQLSAWEQREEQTNRKRLEAEKEVTSLRKILEKIQQETADLKRERQDLVKSHGRALTKMEEDCRQQLASKLAVALEEQRTQNALHLREQREELCREVELEQMIDREKNQLLLLQYQRETTKLQQKLEEREQEVRRLLEDLQQERRSREEERRTQEEEWRRREEERHQELQHFQQQEVLQLSQTKAELQLMAERNAELQEEVALLQETVRRECVEREELTAGLSQAREELHKLQPPASQLAYPRTLPYPPERLTPPAGEHVSLPSKARVPPLRTPTEAEVGGAMEEEWG